MSIGGRIVSPGDATIEVVNPATEEILALAPDATDEELDDAVQSAHRAFRSWRAAPVSQRAEVVRRIGDVLRRNAEELSLVLTSEQGKPVEMARREVERAGRWCGALADLEVPWEERRDTGSHDVVLRRVPLGVVAALVPWNFPVSLALWKIAPALLAGNTVVVKPSPFTPLTALRIGELINGVVPAGVVNVISGGDSLGPRLASHPRIAKIAFTGSTATGKRVMETASRNLLRVTLELGGNDAAIVLPDADLEDIAPKIFWACFQNSGQYCIASKRVYVHDSVYDDLAARVAAYAAGVVIGDGLEPGTQLGPVQNRLQYEKVLGVIEECKREGLRFILPPAPYEGRGFFLSPVIVDDPPDDAAIVTEEPFGPIVPFLRYHDVDEAIARANSSSYGLAGSVWGTDLDAAAAVAARIDAGVVWVNEVHRLEPDLPFGGRKQSGVGVENGVEGVLSYTDTNVVSTPKR